jgi:hypothetical protein
VVLRFLLTLLWGIRFQKTKTSTASQPVLCLKKKTDQVQSMAPFYLLRYTMGRVQFQNLAARAPWSFSRKHFSGYLPFFFTCLAPISHSFGENASIFIWDSPTLLLVPVFGRDLSFSSHYCRAGMETNSEFHPLRHSDWFRGMLVSWSGQ